MGNTRMLHKMDYIVESPIFTSEIKFLIGEEIILRYNGYGGVVIPSWESGEYLTPEHRWEYRDYRIVIKYVEDYKLVYELVEEGIQFELNAYDFKSSLFQLLTY